MGKKRKGFPRFPRNSSSSSDNDDSVFVRKAAKCGGPSDSRRHGLDVSEILSQANSILYESEQECINDSKDHPDPEIRAEVARVDPETMSQSTASTPMGGPHAGSSGATETPQRGASDMATIVGKMDTLLVSVNNIQRNQEQMSRMFEDKLDNLRTDLMANIWLYARTFLDSTSTQND